MQRYKKMISLLVILVMIFTVIPNNVVYADTDVNADSKDPQTGHKTSNKGWKYYPNAGVRISVYFAPEMTKEDWLAKGGSKTATPYEIRCGNFIYNPKSVRQIGTTIDIMKKGTNPNYTVDFYSNRNVYQYMKELTVYPSDSEAVKAIKEKKNLTFAIQTNSYSKNMLVHTDELDTEVTRKMPTNLEETNADVWMLWLTGQKAGVGLSEEEQVKLDKKRDYTLIVDIAKKAGAPSWFSVENFKNGTYQDDYTKSMIDGVYKVFVEPTISAVLDGAGTQATFRDLLAWGQTKGWLNKLGNMKPLLSTVGDVACLAEKEPMIGLKGIGTSSVSGTSSGVTLQKAITKGGTLFGKGVGVCMVEPQKDKPEEEEKEKYENLEVKVYKTLVQPIVDSKTGDITYTQIGEVVDSINYKVDKATERIVDEKDVVDTLYELNHVIDCKR